MEIQTPFGSVEEFNVGYAGEYTLQLEAQARERAGRQDNFCIICLKQKPREQLFPQQGLREIHLCPRQFCNKCVKIEDNWKIGPAQERFNLPLYQEHAHIIQSCYLCTKRGWDFSCPILGVQNSLWASKPTSFMNRSLLCRYENWKEGITEVRECVKWIDLHDDGSVESDRQLLKAMKLGTVRKGVNIVKISKSTLAGLQSLNDMSQPPKFDLEAAMDEFAHWICSIVPSSANIPASDKEQESSSGLVAEQRRSSTLESTNSGANSNRSTNSADLASLTPFFDEEDASVHDHSDTNDGPPAERQRGSDNVNTVSNEPLYEELERAVAGLDVIMQGLKQRDNQLANQVEQLKTDRKELDRENQSLTSHYRLANDRLSKNEEERARLEIQVADMQRFLDGAAQEKSNLEQRDAAAKEMTQRLRSENDKLEAEVQHIGRENDLSLRQLNTKMANDEETIEELKGKNRILRGDLTTAEAQLSARNEKIEDLEARLVQAEKELGDADRKALTMECDLAELGGELAKAKGFERGDTEGMNVGLPGGILTPAVVSRLMDNTIFVRRYVRKSPGNLRKTMRKIPLTDTRLLPVLQEHWR